jgi:hypothetical protein
MSAPLPTTVEDAGKLFKRQNPKAEDFTVEGGKFLFPAYSKESERKELLEDIQKDAFEVEDVPLPVGVEAKKGENFIAQRLTLATSSLSSKFRTKILGVDYSAVTAAFLSALALARSDGNPQDLVYDMVISVAAAYTISRDVVADYKGKGATSMLTAFEIQDRKRADEADIGKKNAWVENSGMNSSALHILGYMIVDCAPDKGFLAQVRATKGTPFSPPKAGKELEKLIIQASTELTDSDKNALIAFKAESETLVKVVDILFGKAGASVDLAKKAAASVKVAYF